MKSRSSAPVLVIIVFLVLGGLIWANHRFVAQNPGGNDFLARWMGARYWIKDGISPYDEQVSLASQEAIYGRAADPEKGEDIAHFAYPLTSMVFFAPFALMDFTTARVLWMTVLEISLILLALVSIRLANWRVSPLKAAALILFSLLWYHGARTIIIGQFAGINALLIGLALLLIRQKQDIVAGVLLALSTAKPQMTFLLIPFVLLWALSARRRDLFWSTILSTAFLFGLSLLFRPNWPVEMFYQMLSYPSYTNIGSPIAIIAGSMPGIRSTLSILLHGITIVYLVVEWFIAVNKDENWFLWTALATVVVTNLIAYRTATTNYVMMLPALFMVFKIWEDRWKESGRWLVWFSLPVLGFGLWALFLFTVQGNVEQAVMYLPLPFLCLLGLWWVRWWVIRPPKVLLEALGDHFA